MPWIWGLMSPRPLMRAAETVHKHQASWTNSSTLAGSLMAGMLAGRVWDSQAWGFACLLVAHILFNNIFFFISCVFRRGWAKPGLIRLCFVLRSKGSNHPQLIFEERNLFRLLCGQPPQYFCLPHLLPVWHQELSVWSVQGPCEEEKQDK